MNFFRAEVKKYEKKYKKRTKSGKTRDATTVQFSIPLNKDNPFQEENYIYILTNDELNVLKEELGAYKKADVSRESDSNNYKKNLQSINQEKEELNNTLSKTIQSKANLESENAISKKKVKTIEAEIHKLNSKNEDLQNKLDELQSKFDKRQNRIDALSERLNKSLKTESNLEHELRKYTTAMVKIETRGFIDRILNRIPEDIKQLTTIINENSKK